MSLTTRVARGFVDPNLSLARDFDLLGHYFNGVPSNGTDHRAYGVDVREEGDQLIVEAEMPGFTKEEVDITLENQTLTLAAKHSEVKTEQKSGNYLLNERRLINFQRSFTLPRTMDEKSVQAKLANGLLTVTINRREETKPRKIPVA